MIESIKPISNQVLIRLTRKGDEIELANGHKLHLDVSYNEEEHRPVVGEVIAVPAKLTFKDGDLSTMPWKTEMQLQKGDIVIMRRPAVSSCFVQNSGRIIEQDGEQYLFIKYSDIILAKRQLSRAKEPYQVVGVDGKAMAVIMLNGFILLEPDEEEYKTFLELPKSVRRLSKLTGTVRYLGMPNLAYQTMVDTTGQDTTLPPDYYFDIKVGDKVVFHKAADIPLEQDLHQSFEGRDKKYFRCQRHKLLAII
jgi:co-chaperonin GroES (HSP10)